MNLSSQQIEEGILAREHKLKEIWKQLKALIDSGHVDYSDDFHHPHHCNYHTITKSTSEQNNLLLFKCMQMINAHHLEEQELFRTSTRGEINKFWNSIIIESNIDNKIEEGDSIELPSYDDISGMSINLRYSYMPGMSQTFIFA